MRDYNSFNFKTVLFKAFFSETFFHHKMISEGSCKWIPDQRQSLYNYISLILRPVVLDFGVVLQF